MTSVYSRRAETFRALDAARAGAHRIPGFSPSRSKFVVMSDWHKGNGRKYNDDFRPNAALTCHALSWYRRNGFSLILNGDIEDCWEDDPETIVKAYGRSVFAEERRFNDAGRYYRTSGNHDSEWTNRSLVKRHLAGVLGPVEVHPALLLSDGILVVHGHQGDPHSDPSHQWNRWLVKSVWAPLQRLGLSEPLIPTLLKLGIHDAGRASANNLIRRERDQFLYEWAGTRGLLVIAGHTHRAMFRSFSKVDQVRARRALLVRRFRRAAGADERLRLWKAILETDRIILQSIEEFPWDKIRNRLERNPLPCYFNAGSGVYKDGITAIELDRGQIRLVKWQSSTTGLNPGGMTRQGSAPAVRIDRKVYQYADLRIILKAIAKADAGGRRFGRQAVWPRGWWNGVMEKGIRNFHLLRTERIP
jgi:UDP-2,3-diacylglucosamine pyrophosphatase LpxH